jgi:hypothetical protein
VRTIEPVRTKRIKKGVTPVQAFTSRAVPVTGEEALTPCLGRPARQTPATLPEPTRAASPELPGAVAGPTEQPLPEKSV